MPYWGRGHILGYLASSRISLGIGVTQPELEVQSIEDLPLVRRGQATYKGSQIERIAGWRKRLCGNLIANRKQS